MNQITIDDCEWSHELEAGGRACYCFYKKTNVARLGEFGHFLGVEFPGLNVYDGHAEVVRRLNELNKVQRQAIVIGACWPGVWWLAKYKSWRAAWEAAEYTSDMRWLLWRLGMDTNLTPYGASADDIRALFPWEDLRAKSLQIWPLPSPRHEVGVFSTRPRGRPRRYNTGFGGFVNGCP